MNAPYNGKIKLTPTGAKDRNGNEIRLGDMVRVYDSVPGSSESYMGKVVFKNCAFRILPISDWCSEPVKNPERYLQFNHTLLFDEITGTSSVEVI